ncbi:peptidyl-prolyl cis-trans isomerase ppiC [Klebsiella pneumoniae]|nr:peptidyl-prolyl cis-trans isomerase ppiC [Klebsiella pneumoniae]
MAKTAAALHILVKEEKLALDLLEQLKNGADFGKLAKKHSICPSGKRGGDLGEFRQGQMVPAFDKVVFSCPELEPTGPLHTQFRLPHHQSAVPEIIKKPGDLNLRVFA